MENSKPANLLLRSGISSREALQFRPRGATETHTEISPTTLEVSSPTNLSKGFENMLKTTTETGNIGMFSIKPPRVPQSFGTPRKSTRASSDSGVQRTRQPIQPYGVPIVDDRRRLPSYAKDAATDLISKIANQKSANRVFDEPEYRSYSMTQTSYSSYTLSNYKSHASLRGRYDFGTSGVVGASNHLLQRPRSPFAYPARLRRPGFRPSSPALTDGEMLDYSRRAEIDRGTYISDPRVSSLSTQNVSRQKTAIGTYAEANASASFLLNHSSPNSRSSSPRNLKMRANDWARTNGNGIRSLGNSPARSTFSLASRLNARASTAPMLANANPHRMKQLTPLYYDYTEDFEDESYGAPDGFALPFTIDKTILEDRPLSPDERGLGFQGGEILDSNNSEKSLPLRSRSLKHNLLHQAQSGNNERHGDHHEHEHASSFQDPMHLNIKEAIPEDGERQKNQTLVPDNKLDTYSHYRPSGETASHEHSLPETSFARTLTLDTCAGAQTDQVYEEYTKYSKHAAQCSNISRAPDVLKTKDTVVPSPTKTYQWSQTSSDYFPGPANQYRFPTLTISTKLHIASTKTEAVPEISSAISSTDSSSLCGHSNRSEAGWDPYSAITIPLSLTKMTKYLRHMPQSPSSNVDEGRVQKFAPSSSEYCSTPQMPSPQFPRDVLGDEFPILAPKAISPVRQLRLKNSVPHLMKALPPLPLDMEFQSPSPRLLQELRHEFSPRQKLWGDFDAPTERQSTPGFGSATNLPISSSSSKWFPSHNEVEYGVRKEVRPDSDILHQTPQRMKLKMRSSNIARQELGGNDQTWKLENNYNYASQDVSFLCHPRQQENNQRQNRFRMRVTKGAFPEQGTVRIYRNSVDGKQAQAFDLGSHKDLFTPASGIGGIFRKVRTRIQPQREGSAGCSGDDGKPIEVLSTALSHSHRESNQLSEESITGHLQPPSKSLNPSKAQSCFSDDSSQEDIHESLRRRLTNSRTKLPVPHISKSGTQSYDDITWDGCEGIDASSPTVDSTDPDSLTSAACAEQKPKQRFGEKVHRQYFKARMQSFLRDATAVVASQVKPRGTSTQAEDEAAENRKVPLIT